MVRKHLLPFSMLLIFIVMLLGCKKQEPVKTQSNMAQLCQSCHKEEPGVMRGFLDSVAFKSKTL